MRKDLVVYHARLEGKVLPLTAEQIAKIALKDLQEIAGKTAATVPVGQITPLHVQAPAADGAQVLTETDRRIAAGMGYTPEQVAKANNLRVG
jgi:hypothetical protein